MTPPLCTECLRPFVVPHECEPRQDDSELFKLAYLLLRRSVIKVRVDRMRKLRERGELG